MAKQKQKHRSALTSRVKKNACQVAMASEQEQVRKDYLLMAPACATDDAVKPCLDLPEAILPLGSVDAAPSDEECAELEGELKLPLGHVFVDLEQLMAICLSLREFVLLTGVEEGFAGLNMELIQASYDTDVGSAFSFCLDGRTYTAVEDSIDGYRSCLGSLIAREGNFCKTQFEACALWPAMNDSEDEHIFELRIQPGGEPALFVGTSYYDSYYPCFVGGHSAQMLQLARDMGTALAIELDETLPHPSLAKSSAQRL